MKPTRIVKVTKPFIDAFKNATGATEIEAVRESSIDDREMWFQARLAAGLNTSNSAGESILAPNNIWIDLTDRLITAPKTRAKVPFVDAYYRPFANYGSIIVFSENSPADLQTLYMPSDEIKVIKSLIETPQFYNHDNTSYGEFTGCRCGTH